MHTKLPNISFFKNSSFFVAWFSKNSRENFWNRNFKANCLSRRHQKVYSIFSKSCPTKAFYSKVSKVERKVYQDGLLPIVITNSFRIPVVQKLENIFTHIFFIFFCIGIYSLFKSNNKIHDGKRRPKQIYSFHTHADIKQCLHILKVHLEIKHSWTKTRRLPLIGLLVIIDKFFEFCRIYVDQIFIFEDRAILGMLPTWINNFSL